MGRMVVAYQGGWWGAQQRSGGSALGWCEYMITLLKHAKATCSRLKGGHAKSYILSALTEMAHSDAPMQWRM